MRKKMSRRAFLRGAGGVAVSLPFLGAMGCSRKSPLLGNDQFAAEGLPKRIIFMFSANGTIRENWSPSGGETDFSLSKILAPLERHKSDLVILDGVDMTSAYNGPGDGHQKGMGHLLTGTELLEGDLFEGGGDSGKVGWGGGISVDQEIANHIGDATKFRSLAFGVQVQSNTVWSRMSYRGPNDPVPPEDDPRKALARIFGDLGADPFGLEERAAKRQTVLDAVSADYKRLNAQLGAEDRERMDIHIAAIEEIERSLNTGGGQVGGACKKPMISAPEDIYANDNYPAIGKVQTDLLVMALACDLTRVATLQWHRSVSNKVFRWLENPIPDGHHSLSHEGDSNSVAMDKITRINTWYAEQLAYLLDRLKAVPEGDGTMLDNTVVVWGNELGRGNNHTRKDIPFVLAGRAGGALKSGRYLKYDQDPHNNLHVSLLNMMGIDTNTFGNPAYCTGPLSGLA